MPREVLCGMEGLEDAGVYKLNEKLALIFTLDFFTPIVDSPYHFGKIAAVNSMSDVYAMGGKPLMALNILCMPSNMDKKAIEGILKGGFDAVVEAGAYLLGGHSIQDREPKYGLAVLGTAKPKDIKRNNGGKAGDILYLTKPLGVGILTTALKNKKIKEKEILNVIKGMEELNYKSSSLAVKYKAKGVTDVTGFSFLGHLSEMLSKNIGAKVYFERIPFYENSLKFAQGYTFPGGTYSNKKYFEKFLKKNNLKDFELLDLFSPETSGGLLISLDPKYKRKFEEEAKKIKQKIWEVGILTKGDGITIV